ncbi:alpha/beta hydrolase [Herbiconiux solani]|uniref:alpha/beta hydrolase n=1 Tax=Herbiconiux solani TaxID=661329 RepID=UPI001470B3FD|nr:alpha/beta hydrolase fold domain-containing protein [Herbiconiux solani]
MSVTDTATNAFPPTFLSVGDADPFRPQVTELAAALQARGVPVTTLMWDGTGDKLGHEYHFDFSLPLPVPLPLPQAQTALQATLDFLDSLDLLPLRWPDTTIEDS